MLLKYNIDAFITHGFLTLSAVMETTVLPLRFVFDFNLVDIHFSAESSKNIFKYSNGKVSHWSRYLSIPYH